MSYKDTVLADSPVAYWRLGEASGTVAADASGNGRDGTYVGGPTLGVAGLLTGDPNTAVDFDGVDDLASVADGFSFLPPSEITIELWQTVFEARQQYTIAWNSNTGNNRIVLHSPWSDGRIYWDFGDLASGGRISAVFPTQHIGQRVHIVCVASVSQGRMAIYLNGELLVENNAATPGISSAVSAFSWGGRTGGSFFKGTLDEVAVYATALSAAQVKEHFDIGSTHAITDSTGKTTATGLGGRTITEP